MKKSVLGLICVFLLTVVVVSGCSNQNKSAKIGVSFGVGAATRWPMEQGYMEERAKELGAEMEVRLNTTDKPKTQVEDCKELIDSGIDVLIYIPRDVNNATEVLEYAKKKNVKVIDYARVVLKDKVDLFVGYDSNRMGQSMGQYLTEKVYKGDYIILRGDPNDNNATLLYNGAMSYVNPLKGKGINVILDEAVPGWSVDTAKQLVKDAVTANGNKVDAILAPNDKLAGAAIEALSELGVTTPVAVTGMDAELEAVRRVAAGTQEMTLYMDIKELSRKAVEEADKMAKGQKIDTNAEFDNQSESNGGIPSYLINGQIITSKNIDKILIDSGYYTKEQVYGKQ